MNDASDPSLPDPLERRAKRLNFWVVWGFAVLDVILALFQPIHPPYSAPLLLAIAGVTCQVSLLTIWVALGQNDLKERLPMVVPAYSLAAFFLGALNGRDFFQSAALALLLLFLFDAIIPYGMLRLLGVHCLSPSQAGTWKNIERRRRPMQFSLAALFIMTFVAACAAGVIRMLQPRMDVFVGEVALLGLSSLFALAGIWSMLARGAFLPRAVLFVALSIFAGIAVDRMIAVISQGRAEPWAVSAWVTIHLTAMLGVLLLYRRNGYRVVRGDLRGEDGSPESGEPATEKKIG